MPPDHIQRLHALAAADQAAAAHRELEERFERRISRGAVTALSIGFVAAAYAVAAASRLAPAAPWAVLA